MNWVLFVCVENKARSQIAEALFNKLAEESKVDWRAMSAGTMPGEEVYPETRKVIEEEGINFKGKPKLLTQKMIDKASLIITMGCGVEAVCPAVFLLAEDWNLPDPKGKSLKEFRELKEDIKRQVQFLIERLKKP